MIERDSIDSIHRFILVETSSPLAVEFGDEEDSIPRGSDEARNCRSWSQCLIEVFASGHWHFWGHN